MNICNKNERATGFAKVHKNPTKLGFEHFGEINRLIN